MTRERRRTRERGLLRLAEIKETGQDSGKRLFERGREREEGQETARKREEQQEEEEEEEEEEGEDEG